MLIPEILKFYFEKPVAIFGNGISGNAVANLLNDLKVDSIIYDQLENKNLRNEFSQNSCLKHKLIIYSPGFPSDHPWLQCAEQNGCYTLGELDFASLFWKGKIIAITGTNGKSTLTQFLSDALKNMGLNAFPCGNIGNPLSALHPYFQDVNAIAVCEVSSFQAEGLKHFSPDALLWTNFDEDHLDRHTDLEDYFNAKWSLVNRLKSNFVIIGKSVKQFAEAHGYSFEMQPFIVDEKVINGFDSLPKGIFSKAPQIENYALALSYWIAQNYDYQIFEKTVLSFKSLKYRLEKVATIDGKNFWNDGKGTNFLATIKALKSFNKKVFWIGGGKYKGGDLENFVNNISPFIEEAFLIGQTAETLAQLLQNDKIKVSIFCSLEDSIKAAFENCLPGTCQDIVFSPAFSSFDMFTNANERGNFFEMNVLELKRREKTLLMSLS